MSARLLFLAAISGNLTRVIFMERSDRELIERVAPRNFELHKLYQRHKELEERLDKLGKKAYLTPGEEQEQRQLKQVKLRGVEKMLKLAEANQNLAA
jgi:hypothetical protein